MASVAGSRRWPRPGVRQGAPNWPGNVCLAAATRCTARGGLSGGKWEMAMAGAWRRAPDWPGA
eukprot:11542655-Alexandrium_andersonii.AAC.1